MFQIILGFRTNFKVCVDNKLKIIINYYQRCTKALITKNI
jgi:hypothetical protein